MRPYEHYLEAENILDEYDRQKNLVNGTQHPVDKATLVVMSMQTLLMEAQVHATLALVDRASADNAEWSRRY